MFSKKNNIIFIIFNIIISILILCYIYKNNHNYFTTVLFVAFFGNLTASFSMFSYFNSSEQLRLQLFEKRYVYYCNLVNYFDYILGSYDHKIMTKAYFDNYDLSSIKLDKIIQLGKKTFSNKNGHAMGLLFNNEFDIFFESVQDIHMFFLSYKKYHSGSGLRDEIQQHLELVHKLNSDMPKLFKKYIYFGSYAL